MLLKGIDSLGRTGGRHDRRALGGLPPLLGSSHGVSQSVVPQLIAEVCHSLVAVIEFAGQLPYPVALDVVLLLEPVDGHLDLLLHRGCLLVFDLQLLKPRGIYSHRYVDKQTSSSCLMASS